MQLSGLSKDLQVLAKPASWMALLGEKCDEVAFDEATGRAKRGLYSVGGAVCQILTALTGLPFLVYAVVKVIFYNFLNRITARLSVSLDHACTLLNCEVSSLFKMWGKSVALGIYLIKKRDQLCMQLEEKIIKVSIQNSLLAALIYLTGQQASIRELPPLFLPDVRDVNALIERYSSDLVIRRELHSALLFVG